MTREKTDNVQVKVNLPAKVRAELERSAQERGWTLNREVVDRITQSLADEQAMGGADRAALLRVFGSLLAAVERRHGKSFFEDYATALAGRQALIALIDELMPLAPQSIFDKYQEMLGSLASGAAQEIRDREKRGERLSYAQRFLITLHHRRNAEKQIFMLDPDLLSAVTEGQELGKNAISEEIARGEG